MREEAQKVIQFFVSEPESSLILVVHLFFSFLTSGPIRSFLPCLLTILSLFAQSQNKSLLLFVAGEEEEQTRTVRGHEGRCS